MAFGTATSRKMPTGMLILFGIKWIQYMLTVGALMYIFILPPEIVLNRVTRPGNDSELPSKFFPESESVVHFTVAVLPWAHRFCPTGTCWTLASLIAPALLAVLGFGCIMAMSYRIVNADRTWDERKYRSLTVFNFVLWIVVAASLGYLLKMLEINVVIYDSAFYTSIALIAVCLAEVLATFLFETTSDYVPIREVQRETNETAYVKNIIDFYDRHDTSRLHAPNTDVYRSTVV